MILNDKIFVSTRTMEKAKSVRAIIEEKIPDGLIVPEHTEREHFYRHTGKNVLVGSSSGIAGILKADHLKIWAARMCAEYINRNLAKLIAASPKEREEIFRLATLAHDERFQDAGAIGTIGHGFVDEYLMEWIRTGVQPESITSFIKETETDNRAWAIARSAELFCKDFEAIPVASELKVISLKHKFGGTLDAIMMVKMPNGKHELCLVDWKTSNAINKIEYAMQTASYREAFKELTGVNIKHIIIVRLDKFYAKYEVLRVKNNTAAFARFKNCIPLYQKEELLEKFIKKEVVSLSTPHAPFNGMEEIK